MRVSSLDFRGIFQIILKMAIFSVSSAFLSIFYKRAEYKRHAFLQILVFLPVLAVSFQTYGFISATQYDHRSTLLTPCGFNSGDLLSLPRCIQQTFMCPMYVGRPSASADSEHPSAHIAQMQATAYAASFSSSHPGDSTPDIKHGTMSMLYAAAAYRHLPGDSLCFYQCSYVIILPHRATQFHHSSSSFSNILPMHESDLICHRMATLGQLLFGISEYAHSCTCSYSQFHQTFCRIYDSRHRIIPHLPIDPDADRHHLI